MADAPVIRTFDWKTNPNHAQQQVDAMRAHLGLGDPAISQSAIENTMIALRAISEQLRATDWKGTKPGDLAKNASYLAKVVDEIYRLAQFAGGGPDHRTELGLSDLLQVLTPEQFSQVQDWIAASKAVPVDP